MRNIMQIILISVIIILTGCNKEGDKGGVKRQGLETGCQRIDVSVREYIERFGRNYICERRGTGIIEGEEIFVPRLIPESEDAIAQMEGIMGSNIIEEKRWHNRIVRYSDTGEIIAYYPISGFISYYRKRYLEPIEGVSYEGIINRALGFVLSNGIIEVGGDEELEITGVSVERAKAVGIKEVPEYNNDPEPYLAKVGVRIGRRYRGVPVIGSYVYVEYGAGEGGVAEISYISRNWRRIVVEGGRYIRVRGREEIEAEGMNYCGDRGGVEKIECGYIEANRYRSQRYLQLGCKIRCKGSLMDIGKGKIVRAEVTELEPIMGEVIERVTGGEITMGNLGDIPLDDGDPDNIH